TVLVGKNEVGKTSLLKALHKLKPFRNEPYLMDSEWPRGRRTDRNDTQTVCTARLELNDTEIANLSKLTQVDASNRILEVSRDYAGRLKAHWLNEDFPSYLPTAIAEQVLSQIPVLDNQVKDEFRNEAEQIIQEVRTKLGEKGISTLNECITGIARHLEVLNSKRSPQGTQPNWQNEQKFIDAFNTMITELSKSIEEHQATVLRWINDNLPTFIYMSDYRAFAGSAQLDQVKQRKDRNQLTEEDRTLLMVMGLSGLNLESEVTKGNSPDREQRQYDLDDASATLTRMISDRWHQRKYEVAFRADGQLFYTFVKDQRDPSLIKLEERSQGFQWFFSFDLMFMFESQGSFKGCVLLLDEPGLHLHPEAQLDLLKRMEEYARDNTMIYTTHLPFLIDLRRPERIRVLNETEHGTIVSSDLTQSQPEAKFVLQAALGMSGSQSFLVSTKNLVVEGVDDYWVITELSNLMKRCGKNALPDDLLITPAGGASEAAYIATFMVGQKLDAVVLLDSDQAGSNAYDSLTKSWITRYQKSRAQVLLLGPTLGVVDRAFAIEDIFPEEQYRDWVLSIYSKQMAAANLAELKLVGNDGVSRKVDRALKSVGIQFNKGSVAKLIKNYLLKIDSFDDLPAQTKEYSLKLIQTISDFYTK
ncbi:AAA family ATPase, partial [Candidatus Bathyarchaeota archaeon]|nr:AAA family ATPase [Candidatus Bathyarchaeota archaeon]